MFPSKAHRAAIGDTSNPEYEMNMNMNVRLQDLKHSHCVQDFRETNYRQHKFRVGTHVLAGGGTVVQVVPASRREKTRPSP